MWSCGLRTGVLGAAPSNANLASAAGVVATQIGTVISSATNVMGTTVTLTQCTARYLNAAGQTVDLAIAPPAAPVSGVGTVQKPNQCALVVTLLTNAPTRRGRGRIYLPFIGGASMSAGKYNAPVQIGVRDSMKAAINAINSSITTSLAAQLCVHSQVAPLTTASVQLITAIRVGDVIDTQRGRRDGIVETYSVASIP